MLQRNSTWKSHEESVESSIDPVQVKSIHADERTVPGRQPLAQKGQHQGNHEVFNDDADQKLATARYGSANIS